MSVTSSKYEQNDVPYNSVAVVKGAVPTFFGEAVFKWV